jgi:ankyrin repeat protein
VVNNRHKEVVELLLKSVDLNIPTSGDTLLNCVVLFSHTAVVKLLLNRKDVDPNAKGKHSYTPLMNTAKWGNKEVVQLLLS